MARYAALPWLAAAELFCPGVEDLTIAYCAPNCPTLQNQGWTIAGGGGVASRTSFNLLGGYVEFDLDVSDVQAMVNANLYSISPQLRHESFNKSTDYCDGASLGERWCVEMDWIESNGGCGGATTIHTIEGSEAEGCTAHPGCQVTYHYGAKRFHMRVDYDESGRWLVTRDGQRVDGLSPAPDDATWGTVRGAYASRGAVLYSSQWVGWVPLADCGSEQGSLDQSVFRVSNLVVSGAVVQGPRPNLCEGALV